MVDKSLIPSLIVLVTINVMDSVMNSVTSPTLIFYVLELGGNKDDYGSMGSVTFLAMLLMTTVYGKWIDSNGNKYRAPYYSSFAIAIVSYLMYFFSILLPKGPIAVYTLVFSRFLDGLSIAGRTLAYSYIATVIPQDEQKTVLTCLSMTRTFGQVVGPLANVLVSEIDTEFKIFGVTVPLDPYNSIGLVMVFSEVFLTIFMTFFLDEPPTKEINEKKNSDKKGNGGKNSASESKGVLYALGHFDIFLPIFIMFAMLCNFGIIITAQAPVAMRLGWTAVEISEMMAYQSFVIFAGMCISMALSFRNVPNTSMIIFGFVSFFIGGASAYLLWDGESTYWQFVGPCYLMCFSYPFIGPSIRTMYSKALHSKSELAGSQGVMMSLINQAMSLGGLVSPAFVASFVLRDAEDVKASSNTKELTAFALYVPILSAIAIAGVFYQSFFLEKAPSEERTDAVASETSKLLFGATAKKKLPRSSQIEISETFSRASEVSRRQSVECNGIINPFETKDEKEFRDKLWKEKMEWDEINKITENDIEK